MDDFWSVDHPCKRCTQNRYKQGIRDKQVMQEMVVRATGKTGDDIDVNDLFALIENLDKVVKADVAMPLSPETEDAAVREMGLNI